MNLRAFSGVIALVLVGGLTWAVLALPTEPRGLTEKALTNLEQSGVRNPVTAVLLNYRSYDTLLEIGVLLLAIIGVWSLRRVEWPAKAPSDRPLLPPLLRMVLPVLVLAAGYLLWIGAFAPGGAFQGGALIGGAIVLGILGGVAHATPKREPLLRAGLVVGTLVFASAGGAAMLLTGGFLRYPTGAGGSWILVIESAAMLSIGLTLGLLYLGGRPSGGDHDSTLRNPADDA